MNCHRVVWCHLRLLYSGLFDTHAQWNCSMSFCISTQTQTHVFYEQYTHTQTYQMVWLRHKSTSNAIVFVFVSRIRVVFLFSSFFKINNMLVCVFVCASSIFIKCNVPLLLFCLCVRVYFYRPFTGCFAFTMEWMWNQSQPNKQNTQT